MSATTNVRFYPLMFGNQGVGIPSTTPIGCGIRMDTNLSDTTYVGWCDDAGTRQDVTITGTVNTSPHRFRMWQTAQGTVNFSVDGGTTASLSAGIPTVTTTNLTFSMLISNDGTSTTRAMDLFRAVGRITGLSVP